MKKREKEGRARLPWADLVRAAAIVCVVLCHAAEATFQFIYPDIMVQCSALTQLLAYAAMAIGRMGVPLFLFLSGWFLLARQYDTPGALLFWKRHLPGLVLTVEIWLVLYAVFDAVRPGGIAFSARRLVRNMTFQEYTQGHMWYMPMILGLYLFVPFVACAVQRLGLRAFAVPALRGGFFALCSRPRTWCCWRWAASRWRRALAGFWRRRIRPAAGRWLSGPAPGACAAVRAAWLALAGTACFAGLVWLEFFAYAHGVAYNVRYNCFLLAGQALCLFELFEPCGGACPQAAGGKPCALFVRHLSCACAGADAVEACGGRHCRDAHAHRGIFCPAVGGKLGAGAFSWKNTGAGQGAVLPAVRSCARVTL